MKSERLELRVEPAWLAKVDEWRRHHPAIPTRNEAIQQLVELGLAAPQPPAGAGKPRTKPVRDRNWAWTSD